MTSEFVDTYLKSTSEEALLEIKNCVKNMIGPAQGRAAIEETADEEGNVVPAQEAAGDPAYWYVSVRAPFPVPAYADIDEANVETCRAVCGIWA